MDTSDRNNLLASFAPVVGIISGYLVGWFLVWKLQDSGIDFYSIKVYTLVFSISGWSIGIMIQGKAIYGGGRFSSDKDDYSTHALLNTLMSPLMLVAATFLFSGDEIYCLLILLVVVTLLSGAISRGDPFFVLKAF